jgi:hypothetical protein
LLVQEGERAALDFQRKDFGIVRKIKFAPKPDKPRRLDTLSNVLGEVRVGSRGDAAGDAKRQLCSGHRITWSRASHRGCGTCREFRGHTRDDGVPSVRQALAEQPRARVPRAGRAIEQPAEVGDARQQHPERFAHGAGEMRDRGVDADDEVELGDDGRRIGEVVQLGVQVDHAAASAEVVRVGGADVLLQADEAGAGNAE